MAGPWTRSTWTRSTEFGLRKAKIFRVNKESRKAGKQEFMTKVLKPFVVRVSILERGMVLRYLSPGGTSDSSPAF
jgi:hypothetical protein